MTHHTLCHMILMSATAKSVSFYGGVVTCCVEGNVLCKENSGRKSRDTETVFINCKEYASSSPSTGRMKNCLNDLKDRFVCECVCECVCEPVCV